MPRSAAFVGFARQQINFCGGSKNRCLLIDQKTSKSSGRIASATARFTESGHRLKRGTDSISGASGEGSAATDRRCERVRNAVLASVPKAGRDNFRDNRGDRTVLRNSKRVVYLGFSSR
jgi:hypothetical protein